jgi:hypothetical protein
VPPDAIVELRDVAIAQALKIGNRLHAAGGDIGMNLERHPVFHKIELGPDLVENCLTDVAERSIEVVKDDQFMGHCPLLHDIDLAICQWLTSCHPFDLCRHRRG